MIDYKLDANILNTKTFFLNILKFFFIYNQRY